MASFESGFRAKDTPHGYTKREILRQYLAGYFRRHLTNAVNCGPSYCDAQNWSICYIDAFAWRGEYDGFIVPDYRPLVAPKENFNKGSPILALLEGLKAIKDVNQRCIDQASFQYAEIEFEMKAIHFIFNDLKEENIRNLKKLVPLECQKYGWHCDTNDVDNVLEYQLFDGSVRWLCQITFVVGKFEDLAVPTDADNIFSFIDTCSIKPIPLSTVERFVGEKKEAFINLMVLTILRVGNNPIAQSCIKKVFGPDEAAKVLETAQDKETKLNEKYETFVTEYEKTLKSVSERSDAGAIHFLFSNGKRSSEVGNQFYMVFFCTTVQSQLKDIQNMKYAMQKFTQENGQNRFTDFYSWGGNEVPLGRKTSNEDEAFAIWEKLQGQTLSLYELQQWVVLHSPYPFHARALRLLEKQGCLVVDTSQGDKRVNKSFMASGSEFGKPATNLWKVTFGVDAPTF